MTNTAPTTITPTNNTGVHCRSGYAAELLDFENAMFIIICLRVITIMPLFHSLWPFDTHTHTLPLHLPLSFDRAKERERVCYRTLFCRLIFCTSILCFVYFQHIFSLFLFFVRIHFERLSIECANRKMVWAIFFVGSCCYCHFFQTALIIFSVLSSSFLLFFCLVKKKRQVTIKIDERNNENTTAIHSMQTYLFFCSNKKNNMKTLANESTSCLSVNDLIRLNARINRRERKKYYSIQKFDYWISFMRVKGIKCRAKQTKAVEKNA